MYLIFMDAKNSNVLLAKRSNMDPVARTHAITRELLEKQFPGKRVLSPLERVPSKHSAPEDVGLVTVYKSRNKEGNGRTCGTFETWAVVPGEPTL